MIKRIRHKGLDRFHRTGDASGINPGFAARLRVALTALEASRGPEGMNLPGYRLHRLHGDRKGAWAISLSGNWRLVFEFDGGDATNVDFVDYH
jgi:proteic killer suppression protein